MNDSLQKFFKLAKSTAKEGYVKKFTHEGTVFSHTIIIGKQFEDGIILKWLEFGQPGFLGRLE